MNQTVIDQLQSQLNTLEAKLQESQGLLTDPELGQLAQAEIENLKQQQSALQESLQSLQNASSSSPTPSSSFKHITLEIRPGAGGEEAKIWVDDLIRMYSRYLETHPFKFEQLEASVLKIRGENAFQTFKYESGVHRVQRVPATESQGRIHTSTASVAVLPIIPQNQLAIRDEDLDWQFFRSGGHGGQNVNKVSTAVRLTHTPTGTVVTCSSERSQSQNREIALDMLRSQIWEQQEEERLGSLEEKRRAAIGRAMRAEKIRTYNFPQNRLTDHRLNQSWHNLESILEGNLDDILTALQTLSE